MAWDGNTQIEKIHRALGQLNDACGYSGEIGSEQFYHVLVKAVTQVAKQWGEVEDSHKSGLAYDVNAMLADAIDRVVTAIRDGMDA